MSNVTHQIISKLVDDAEFEQAKEIINAARALGLNDPVLKRFEQYMDDIDKIVAIEMAEGGHPPPTKTTQMKIENQVIQKIRSRAEAGYRKYGTTMERTDLSLQEWLQHLQEELLDASVYAEKLMSRTEDTDALMCIAALGDHFSGERMPEGLTVDQAMEWLYSVAAKPTIRIWSWRQAPAWVNCAISSKWNWAAYVPNTVTESELEEMEVILKDWHPAERVEKGQLYVRM